MIKERLEIEQKYGKSLQNWHARWASHVDTNVPSSIVKHLWLNLLEEGRELSQAHLSVKDRCNDELIKTLGLFRKCDVSNFVFQCPLVSMCNCFKLI
jgi:hypothetical protein